MPDVVVRIYLYALIISTIFFPVLWAIIWLVRPKRRHSLMRTKNLIRDFLFLVTGLLGFYLFSGRLLNNWLIMALMSVMLIATAYLTEALGKLLSKRSQNNGAK
ncbi:MAG: hypothetical protein QOH41_559 [Blastocatellia bacterium]|jgi:membrane protein CcdC involved in cytochrome C biogenesis|nr:hypothetical protein [Blastocatellia bacterium]